MSVMAITTEPRSQDRHTQSPLVVRLPEDMREQVRRRAEDEERTMTQVVRRALKHYFDAVPLSA
jgi:predicted DNA-binding protein